MARGSIAKVNIENTLKTAFGNDWIGNVGGKLYVWANDGGERIQICLALTAPKTAVEAPAPAAELAAPSFGWHFGSSAPAAEPAPAATITAEEQDNIRKMLENLGL